MVSEMNGTWGTAEEVPGTAVLNTGRNAVVTSVSCASAGNCSAGGYYNDGSGDAGVRCQRATAPGAPPRRCPAPPPSTRAGMPQIASVSCGSAGNCSAGGYYGDSSVATQAFVVSETNGTWGTAEEVPGTAALNQGGNAQITSVSCGSAGNCSAGGTYSGSGGQAFVVSEVSGTWGTAEEVPGTAALNTGGNAQISSVSCGAAGNCSAGGSYKDSSGGTQAFVVSSGCQQVTLPDGSYEFSGCVTEEDSGTLDVTSRQSNVDGVQVSASAADQVSYDDGGTQGNELTSSSASTLSLNLAGSSIKVFRGVLAEQLTQPITVHVPKGTQIAGLSVSGTLTLTPGPGGQAAGTIAVTLPAVLGGGTGTLTFTTTVNQGLSSVQISVPHATFMQLFALSNVNLAYTAGTGTWSVSATATTGGGTSTPFTGSLVYTANTLTSASLSVGKISLAGLTGISQLTVTYSNGTWSGTAALTQTSGGTETAAITLGFTGDTLTSGSITAANVPLFGVLHVAGFSMSYASGSWDLAVTTTLAGGGGGSAALTVSGGIITAASLTLTNVTFEGKFTVASATVSYSAAAPNPACSTVPGPEIWCGNWQVQLPQATTITGVSGALAFADGSFASGSIDVSGDVPLIDGVFLTSLGGTLTVSPPPTTITGTAGIAFGPTVNNTTLLSAAGTLTRTLPGTDTSGSYALSNVTLSALGQILGTANVTVPGNGAKTSIDLSLGSSPTTGLTKSALGVTVQVTGQLTGSFTAGSFSIRGATQVTVNGTLLAGGSMKADNNGMAACAATSTGEAGFEYVWSTSTLSVFGTTGCSERNF